MIQNRIIGEYLGRSIQLFCASTSELPNLIPSFQNSTVLLMLNEDVIKNEQIKDFLCALINSMPLAIVINGMSAQEIFDELILNLSLNETKKHIMTNIVLKNQEKALAVFLKSTWPAEERFDEWKHYAVIILGKCNLKDVENIVQDITN